jgi:hypothetical protein
MSLFTSASVPLRAPRRGLVCLALLLGMGDAAGQAQEPPAPPAPAPTLVLRVRDSWTGLGVQQAELAAGPSTALSPSRLVRLGRASSGSVALERGEHRIVVGAPGYRSLSWRHVVRPEDLSPRARSAPAGQTTVWLDPETIPAEVSVASVGARSVPGTALLHGHVVDAATLRPMPRVRVQLERASAATHTDERGYFSLTAADARTALSPDTLPGTDDLLFQAEGYKLYRLANVALFETDTHFIVDMEPGTGATGRDDEHKMLRLFRPRAASTPAERQALTEPTAALDQTSAAAGSTAAALAARVVDPVDSINVLGHGVMSLETYVGNGLNDEWISSWNQHALRAGAVPYRSYGTWYQLNQGNICATASCQVYDGDYSTNTRLAGQSTSGIVLEKAGAVARSEYSAENNCVRCTSFSCVNGDLSCGAGLAGSPAAGWSCLSDSHGFNAGPGQCCFGHGRGMCQWGTQAWAVEGSSWAWMVNHYYNDSGNGTGQRTMFMTSPLTLVTASASPSPVTAGSAFTVNASARSYAEQAHPRVLVRSRLTGVPGSVADGNGDSRVTLNAQAVTSFSVSFAVPATAVAGTYDLVMELWLDVDEDDTIDNDDLSLDSRTFAGAVVVSGGCVSSVPAGRWKGDYWSNKDLSGSPAMVRDDGASVLNFDWGTASPAPACGIGAESFSARWTRTLSLAAGTYRFTVTSDDGFRLYVDGALRIDKWVVQAPTTYTVDVALSAGSHTLRMDYFESTGLAVAKLSWQLVSTCVAGVPGGRWKGEYWSNKDQAGSPSRVRDDGASGLAFDWGAGSPDPACGLGVDSFSARWTRTLSLAAGTYRFTVTSDDGVRLYVDGVLKLDKWILQAPTTYTVDVALSAGNHTLRMDYFENAGGAVAKLSWQVLSTCIAGVASGRWKGEYWSNKDLAGAPSMVRDDGASTLDFDWGTASVAPACGIGAEGFSARWSRTLSLAAGIHRFTVTSDDGFRLYVDGVLKLDKWIVQAPTVYTVDVVLSAGSHTLRLDYFENAGLAVAKLSWRLVDTELGWPNAASAASSDPWLAEHHAEIRRLRPRVLALNFVNHKGMDQMRAQLGQVVSALAEGSRYHGYANAAAPSFLQYEIAYAVDLRDPAPPTGWPYRNSTLYPRENPVEGGWGFDYERLFTAEFAQRYDIRDPADPARRLGLCELIDRGLVHEVWVFGDADVPDVSAAEILERKPVYDEDRRRIPGAMNRCAGNGCFDDEDDIPCARTVRIAWFNNNRGAGCFLESLSHGLEHAGGLPTSPVPYLRRYFTPFVGFDLDTRHGLPFRDWYVCPYSGPLVTGCLSYPSETSVTYNTGTLAGTIGSYDPVCGSAHFPPNARGQYDLTSPYTVRTSCSRYRDGSGQTTAFTSQQFAPYQGLAPDCTGAWQVWWYQNIPGLDNTARDDAGKPMLNWWPFVFY